MIQHCKQDCIGYMYVRMSALNRCFSKSFFFIISKDILCKHGNNRKYHIFIYNYLHKISIIYRNYNDKDT